MKFVFFDIECSGVQKNVAPICAFGYVTCDENFVVKEREDILINPRAKFRLTNRKGNKGLVLPYDYKAFRSCPAFPEVYDYIRDILEDPDAVVFGHAITNDVSFLNLETKRYRLPSFEFRFSDTQFLYEEAVRDYGAILSIEKMAADLGIECTAHKAVDDAYVTMRIFKDLCEKFSSSPADILDNDELRFGTISNYVITPPTSDGFERYLGEREASKEKREAFKEDMRLRTLKKHPKKGGKMKGKAVNFSLGLCDESDRVFALLDRVYEEGGEFEPRFSKAEVFVRSAEESDKKLEQAEERKIAVVTMDELEALLSDG